MMTFENRLRGQIKLYKHSCQTMSDIFALIMVTAISARKADVDEIDWKSIKTMLEEEMEEEIVDFNLLEIFGGQLKESVGFRDKTE